MTDKRKLPDQDGKLPDNEDAVAPEQLPPPGCEDAIMMGCLCPIIDNGYGKGLGKDENGNHLYWYSSDCPVHCPERDVDEMHYH